MQLSRYLLTFPHPDHPEHLLVYSTRKTSLLQLPKALFRDLESGNILASAAEQLMRLGVLVEDHEIERCEVHGMQAAVNRANPHVRASIILGMACNFRCRYCYEGSLKDGSAMTRETADATVDYLLTRFAPGKKKLLVAFYGGEPLLYQQMIRHIAGRLQPEVAARGGEFCVTLVTNGSLLTPETVDELVPLGLTSAKVTVDGPAYIHNANRPYAGGGESFEAILANLPAVAGRIRLSLQGVYTPDDWRRFPELLDALPARGLPPESLEDVSFYPVMRVDDEYAAPHAGSCASTAEPWVTEAALALRAAVLNRGFPHPKLRPSPCMVDVEDGFCVHWDGGIYKCTALAGRPAFRVGDVWRGEKGTNAAYGREHWRGEEQCRQCVYLPLCLGGCRFGRLMATGAMRGVDCQKDFYDAALGTMLIQDMRRGSRLKVGVGGKRNCV